MISLRLGQPCADWMTQWRRQKQAHCLCCHNVYSHRDWKTWKMRMVMEKSLNMKNWPKLEKLSKIEKKWPKLEKLAKSHVIL